MSLKTFLFTCTPEFGGMAELTEFIDARPEIVNWLRFSQTHFLLVSEMTANELADLLLQFNPARTGRFIVVETTGDRNGWLPENAWNLMANPKPAPAPAKVPRKKPQ